MLCNKKTHHILYGITFVLLIFFFGISSMVQLAHAYLTHENINNDWNPENGTRFEADLSSTFFRKNRFINTNGAIQRLLGQREMNGIVKLNNGYLFIPYERLTDEELLPRVQDAVTLKEFLDARGISFIYAITPYTSDKYDPQLPTGVEDYGNENLDRLIELLREAGIEPLDFRKTLQDDGINAYDMVYKTDHHWNTSMGFYAFSKFTGRLMNELHCSVDPQVLDLQNYTVTTYPSGHIGTRGQRTGIYYTGIDDFELITPNFETALNNGVVDGTFEELVVSRSPFTDPDIMSRYTYDKALERSCGSFINYNSKNDKKLLVLTDSFGKAVNPYLILAFNEVRTLGGDIDYDYIEEYQPDAVIMFYYYDFLLSGKTGND